MAEKQYTVEVLRALGQRDAPSPTPPPPLPPGHLRYHLVVEQTELYGTAPAMTLAATLRALADQIEQGDSDG